MQRRLASSSFRAASAAERRDTDIGNIAVLENDASIIGTRNPFSLDGFQVVFTPASGGYRFATSSGGYDGDTANLGTPVTGLGDDDSREVTLPFSFPFYGANYTKVFLNSDGNLTFGEPDVSTSDRSLGRMNSGVPRIAALYTDLDPSVAANSVRVTATALGATFSWTRVPEYTSFGTGRQQTFQITIRPSGEITLAWQGVAIGDAIVGIGPGASAMRPQYVTFRTSTSTPHNGMIAERFGDAQALDVVAAAQRFYETHDDAYDYLAFFNTVGVGAGTGVVAYEITVRSRRAGIGDFPIDVGAAYGSNRRLQAVLNMGTVDGMPADPNTPHPRRPTTGDTGLTVLAHELGHLFLALASVREPNNPFSFPMLGRQLAHWSFRFNSEASILEGNRIRDDGENASPRFTTTATVEGFSPLDQYLMGLRAPGEVPPTFYVANPTTSLQDPRVGVSFNGTRRDVSIDDLIAAEGRRIPDHTLEQRRYRLGMVLIVPPGTQPRPDELALLERYREAIESAWPRYTGDRAHLDGRLRRGARLSAEPAAGVIAGAEGLVEISVDRAPETPLTFTLRAEYGLMDVPATVTIPAGARSATFPYRALTTGVETLRATPSSGDLYASPEARIQIAGATTLQMTVLSGQGQAYSPGQPLAEPIVVQLTDANLLAYAGVTLTSSRTNITPSTLTTDGNGRVTFRWTPDAGELTLRISIPGLSAPTVDIIALGRPAFAAGAVVNAASFRPGLTPGGIATIFGSNLELPEVRVGGLQSQIFYAGPTQINFAVPGRLGSAESVEVRVRNAAGEAVAMVPLLAVQPGIFFDTASGRAAAIYRGSRIWEMYGTGFGSATATAQAGGRAATVLYNGLAPGFVGLQQINVQVDAAVPAGEQTVVISAGGIAANEVKLDVPAN